MTMRHIGLVLADVMRSIESQRATNGPHEFDGDRRNRLGGKASDPRAQSTRDAQLLSGGDDVASNGNGLPVCITPYTGKRVGHPANGSPETARGGELNEKSGAGDVPTVARGGNDVRQAWRMPEVGTHASLATMARDMDRASPNRVPPRGARFMSLITVDGVRVHAATPL